jgi:peptidoglycan/LPS O-acetylase OafA/YrhL
VPTDAALPFWYLRGGDAIRAIACLGIACFHVATGALFVAGDLAGAGGTQTWMTAYGETGRIALRTASTGFYLFFVLSGFLVSAPFVTAFIEGRAPPRLAPYLRNRALRLVPAAWLLFAFVLVRHGTNGATWNQLLAMFTFTDDHVDHPLSTLVGQTWTLRVDLTFYVLVPIATALAIRGLGPRLGPAGRRRAVWSGAVLVAAACLVVADVVPRSTAVSRSPAVLLCLFMPGVALAAALAGRTRVAAGPRTRAAALALSLIGVAVLVGFPRNTLPLWQVLIVVGAGAGLALGGVALLETRTGQTWAWMRSRPVKWVGKRAYGIYLWHLVLMAELSVLFRGEDDPGSVYVRLLPLVVLTTLVVSALSYRLVEQPAMRLRHRANRRTAPAEEALPAAAIPATSSA